MGVCPYNWMKYRNAKDTKTQTKRHQNGMQKSPNRIPFWCKSQCERAAIGMRKDSYWETDLYG